MFAGAVYVIQNENAAAQKVYYETVMLHAAPVQRAA